LKKIKKINPTLVSFLPIEIIVKLRWNRRELVAL
jgi:hypothetical protein